ncbi:Olfactory receptor 4P4 [Fukomys damarensis]|uniref:Olfactory receptor 4P4 n=1 Tax=Fukomys damarensis TaxID=885580 RepID=A0A091DXV7_FUKDA|nr:Olfactory receptor 4P4 [Fukomys damarensis]
MTDLLAERKTISYSNCMLQLFSTHLFRGIEIFILTGMAYDHYVAICRPLHYTVIMSRPRCNWIISACCSGGFLHSASQLLLTVFLPFCGPNEIDHYFCDVYPLLKLACMDTHTFGLLVIANSGLIALVTFVVLMLSYFFILQALRACSVESRTKALSTCSAHVAVVVLFFTPALFIYIRPATTYPEDKVLALFYTIIAPMFNPLIYTIAVVVLLFTPALFIYIRPAATYPEDKVLALFYTIIAPMFNPLIYTLRNTEMKNAMRKVWLHQILLKNK